MELQDRLLRLLRILLTRKIAERAGLLARQAGSSRSHTMTLYLAVREIRSLGPELAPYLLREVIVRASRCLPGFAEIVRHLGDTRTLASLAGGDTMSEVMRQARRLQMDEVVELFTAVPARSSFPSLDETEASRAPGDYISLGMRKTLAKRPHPATIESMLHEQHPLVVRNLLDNPRVTEDLVIKMASLRPTSPEVLQEIAVHERWGTRIRIRRALAFNPYCPPRITHTILPLLTIRDIMEVSITSSLHPSIRRAAKRFILLRMGEMKPQEKRSFSRSYTELLRKIFLQKEGE